VVALEYGMAAIEPERRLALWPNAVGPAMSPPALVLNCTAVAGLRWTIDLSRGVPPGPYLAMTSATWIDDPLVLRHPMYSTGALVLAFTPTL
jgi:hypothetical protein